MNKYFKNISFYLLLLLVFLVITIYIFTHCSLSEMLKSIITGLDSSVILLLLLEVREFKRDRYQYGKLKGLYKRTEIYNVNKLPNADTKYIPLNEEYKAVDSKIELIYHGDRRYTFEAEYQEGRLTAVIYLDPTNPREGNGHYQYIKKHHISGHFMPDLGFYQLQVDEQDPTKRIFLFHKNQIPSGLEEGYEVLERQ